MEHVTPRSVTELAHEVDATLHSTSTAPRGPQPSLAAMRLARALLRARSRKSWREVYAALRGAYE